MTLTVQQDRVYLELQDADARVMFFKSEIDPSDFVKMLSSLARVPITGVVDQLDKVGLIQEIKNFELPISDSLKFKTEEIKRLAEDTCPEGWTVHSCGQCQTSYRMKGSQLYVDIMIVRWVPQS